MVIAIHQSINQIQNTMNKIEIYQTKNGSTEIEVKFENETLWLSQSQIAELFGRDRSVITKHIKNVFHEEELSKESNVQKMHIANSDKPTFFIIWMLLFLLVIGLIQRRVLNSANGPPLSLKII